MRRAVAVVAMGMAAIAACHGGDSNKAVGNANDDARVGSSIALVADDSRVVVVDPDQGSVSIVEADSLDPITRIDVGDEPEALMVQRSGRLLVTTHRGGEVVAIDLASSTVVARAHVCGGAWGLTESSDGTKLAIACEWENAAILLDSRTLSPLERIDSLHRPRALAFVGDDLMIVDFIGGQVTTVHLDGSRKARSLIPQTAPARPALTAMTANLGAAILPAFGDVFVVHELVNNTGDASKEKIADDYGSVVDGNPKINPTLTRLVGTGAPIAYATYDSVSHHAFNGPSALARYGSSQLLVANLSSNDVAMIDLDSQAIARFPVGAGPRGIAVDEQRHLAFVDNTLDGSITRLSLASIDPATGNYDGDGTGTHSANGANGNSGDGDGAPLTRIRPLAARYSAAALTGRKIFHDATNTHMTPAGVVACATCHPDGGDDGLVWFAHTDNIPLKRRRTPNLANSHTGTAPFHWNGEYATMDGLVRATMRDLMAGDGLLIDVDAVTAYIDEMVRAPLPTVLDRAAVDRGRALFVGKATCVGCHAGAELTDEKSHRVLDPPSLQPDDAITQVDTPALHGLFLRAPYLHDGRAIDLRSVFVATHGDVGAMSEAEQDDLLAYLQSL